MTPKSQSRGWTFAVVIVTLVIVKPARPYNMKMVAEDDPDALLVRQLLAPVDDVPVAPSASPVDLDNHNEEPYGVWQPQGGQQQQSQAVPKARWTAIDRSESDEIEEPRSACPPRYEEIIGYCADSPIGNPLAFGRQRCASQCNLNPDCLGFSWDKEADGKTKPFTCTLQHTECRFPTYSTRFGFCRKRPEPRAVPRPHLHAIPPPPPPPVAVAAPVIPFDDLPPIRITEEPNTEILRAYLSTYDQICDSDKQFKTTTVFTCAQYCLADAGCQAFSYDQSQHICRFIGHCQQKQVFKKLFGSSGMPDILSLLNFVLSRANSPPGLLGAAGMGGSMSGGNGLSQLMAAAASPFGPLAHHHHHRPPPPPPPPILPPIMRPPRFNPYVSSEEDYIHHRPHHHRHKWNQYSNEFDQSRSVERNAITNFERADGDCQSPLLDNKVYELDAYGCARKCQRRPDCAGFSVNLYVSSPHECYLRADSCSTPIASSAWVYYRKRGFSSIGVPAAPGEDTQKSEKLFAFYDFLQNNLNKSSNSMGQSPSKKIRARSSVSHNQPSMMRRALVSPHQNAGRRTIQQEIFQQFPQQFPIQAQAQAQPQQQHQTQQIQQQFPQQQHQQRQPVMQQQPSSLRNKADTENMLQYYTAMKGNCKGSVIDQMSGSLNDCAVRCIHTTKCLGFAYDQWEKKCYIKANKCLKPELSPNGVVYYALRM